MKTFLKIAIAIVIAIISALFLNGCTNTSIKQIEPQIVEIDIITPSDPTPILLVDEKYIVINSMLCVDIEDYKKVTNNYQEIKRYIIQLKSQNSALKDVITELTKKR